MRLDLTAFGWLNYIAGSACIVANVVLMCQGKAPQYTENAAFFFAFAALNQRGVR